MGTINEPHRVIAGNTSWQLKVNVVTKQIVYTTGSDSVYSDEGVFTIDTVWPYDVIRIAANSDGELSIITSSVLNDPDRLLVKRFDVDDGLPSREFVERASLKARSGEMFFGGTNGFNVFHPDSIKTNTDIPPVYLTAFSQNYKRVYRYRWI